MLISSLPLQLHLLLHDRLLHLYWYRVNGAVLVVGWFGMKMCSPIKGRDVAVTHAEFPKHWFAGLPPDAYRARRYSAERNKYRVKAGQDQAFWEEHGWIIDQDPRGWFQWYCRFFLGRRSADDARQISRWTGVAGAKGRWKTNLCKKCVHANKRFDDQSVSPVIRQTMLHWAYEITEQDVKDVMKRM